jgi:hypothetical protein
MHKRPSLAALRWLESPRYLNMEDLREHNKQQMRARHDLRPGLPEGGIVPNAVKDAARRLRRWPDGHP